MSRHRGHFSSTYTDALANNIRKADLFDQLMRRIKANQIIVRPTDCDGGEMDAVTDELDLADLIRGQGQYQDLFNDV